MSSKLLDKSITVLAVDHSQMIRGLYRQILSKLGYQNVIPCESIAEAKKLMPKSDTCWIIAQAMTQETTGGLQFLKDLDLESPHRPMVTLVVDTPDDSSLQDCFAYGMLSFIRQPITVQTLQNEFTEFFKVVGIDKGNGTEIAAYYFRKHFRTGNNLDMIVHLERCLLEHLEPTNMGYINLAKAYYQNKEYINALSALHLVQSPNTGEAAAQTKLQSEVISMLKSDPNPSLGIFNTVVVDNDEMATTQLKNYFTEFGVTNCHVFTDSTQAYEFIRSTPTVEIVLVEWRLKGLSGPAFIQRLRQDGLRVPIVIVSSLLTKKDLTLLTEVGVSAIVEKPLIKETFLMNMSWAIQEFRNPSEQKSLLNTIMLHLRNNAIEEATKFKDQYLNDSRIPVGKKLFVEALFCYHENQIDIACAKVTESIKLLGSDSLLSINLLGKCLLKLNKYNEALACFKKASSISPANLMRLCEMADINLVINNQDEAAETIAQAKAIDSTNIAVKICDAKAAIVSGDVEFAEKTLSSMESSTEVIATMNNRAILLSKAGSFNEALEEYIKTLKAIPLKHVKERQTVNYNLSLGYIKADKLKESVKHLQDCQTIESKLTVKAKSLLARVESAISSGTKLVLNLAENDDKSGSSSEVAKTEASKATLTPAIVQKTYKQYCLVNIINSSVPLNTAKSPKGSEKKSA